MAVFLLLFFVLFSPSVSFDATPQEEYKKIQEKMLEQKKKLGETQQRESSILNEIDNFNVNMERIETSLRKYRKTLTRIESEIEAVKADIPRVKSRVERQKEWIGRKLRVMQRFGTSTDTLTVLLTAGDLSEMMRTWKYLESIALYEHKVLGDYRDNLKSLDEKNAKLQSLRAELQLNSEKVKTKESELAERKKSKEVLLSSVRKEKALHQKMLAELHDASRRLLDLIRESSRTDSYAATGFSKLKGMLPWPVNGKVAIPYGSQKDPQFDTPVFRNGVHIRTDPAADATSVHSGKVIFAEWFKGFGQLVIVNHGGGYHSLYGNLSEIFSHVGDIIKDNQVIGKVGTSGILNAPGLYFEIRYKGKPLDPTQWLKRKRG
jgi:septal ring factor EnvC (AmiA/AmiB activator)